MRKLFIAGNWKMNQGPADTKDFFDKLSGFRNECPENIEAAVCPPFVSLPAAREGMNQVKGIGLGAQNLHHEEDGAFTGEVSATMLKELECTYVITGHSERRAIFGETDEQICSKNLKAIEHGVTPITCVGETLEERNADRHLEVVSKQVKGVFAGFSADQALKTVIAYEPVWAIGTGETATPEQAQEMHAYVRQQLKEQFDESIAEKLQILYGGSMKPANADELLAKPDVDGGLIGGASLKADSFNELLELAEKQAG